MTKTRFKFSKNLSLFLIGLWLCVFPYCGNSEGLVSVKVQSQEDNSLIEEFKAELADDISERSMGLMFRQELAKDRAMLFVFEQPSESYFWMKNTLIPLDIIFVDSQKRILNIVENATPQTTTPREPAGPYLYVLEINGGLSDALGIHPGDHLEFNLP